MSDEKNLSAVFRIMKDDLELFKTIVLLEKNNNLSGVGIANNVAKEIEKDRPNLFPLEAFQIIIELTHTDDGIWKKEARATFMRKDVKQIWDIHSLIRNSVNTTLDAMDALAAIEIK
jgi:hypothetical protein